MYLNHCPVNKMCTAYALKAQTSLSNWAISQEPIKMLNVDTDSSITRLCASMFEQCFYTHAIIAEITYAGSINEPSCYTLHKACVRRPLKNRQNKDLNDK